jgi:transposase
MLNGIVDSRKVRAKKVASLSQSTGGSSFIPCCSEEQQEIKMLKETLRQRDEEMRRLDREQR